MLGGLAVVPAVLGRALRALGGADRRARRRWTTALGLGTLLAPPVTAGAVATLFLPSPAVGLVVLALWAALALHARRRAGRVHAARLELSVAGLARPLRLVQLSDVHIGSREPDFLEHVVARALEHDPELLVVTGDLLDESRVGAAELAALARVGRPVYLVIGNHERYVGLAAAIAAIEAQGVRVLRDEAVAHGPLRLIGLDDRDRPDALPALLARLGDDPERVDVMLYHRPDGWQAARARGVPLTLAGHTHGGQIWPFGLLVRRVYPEMTGRFDADGTTLYVSSGTGTWGPTMRLGTRSELTVVDLLPGG